MSGCGPPESPLNVSTGGHQWPALSNARYTDARPIFSVRAISVGPRPSALSCFTRAGSMDALRPPPAIRGSTGWSVGPIFSGYLVA